MVRKLALHTLFIDWQELVALVSLDKLLHAGSILAALLVINHAHNFTTE